MENTFGKRFLRNLPLLLLIVVEIALGIMLFVNPDNVTRAAILIFGILLTVIGIYTLIRFFVMRNQGHGSAFSLVVAILMIVLGAVLLIFPNAMLMFVKGFLGAVFIIYGIGMIISGIYKIYLFFSLKHVDVPVTLFTAIAGIVGVLLGIVILVNVNTVQDIMWRVAGIALLVEAVFDVISYIMNLAKK